MELKRRSNEAMDAYLQGYEAGHKRGLELALNLLAEKEMLKTNNCITLCRECLNNVNHSFDINQKEE